MIIERVYNCPLLALSWRISVGSGLANHGACQQRLIVGFLGGSWMVVSRQIIEWANVGPSHAHPCWLLSGNVWTDKIGPTDNMPILVLSWHRLPTLDHCFLVYICI